MEPLNVGYTVARTFFDGEELVADLVEAAEEEGATFEYRTEAREILFDDGAVSGIRARNDDGDVEYHADAVIVAAGGYESSEEKRTRYYGSDYDAMKVRGSRYNTGEGSRWSSTREPARTASGAAPTWHSSTAKRPTTRAERTALTAISTACC